MPIQNPNVNGIAAIVERMVDHPATAAVRSEALKLRQRAVALDGMNSNRRPVDTPAAHALKVAKEARAFDKEVTTALNRALFSHGESRQRLERRIAEKVNFKIDGDDAREIRAVLRAMKPADRVKAVEKMVEEGRGPELHAVVSGTELTTGIHDNLRNAFRDKFVAKHAAPELEEQQRIEDALESFVAAQRAAGKFVRELTDPGKLADIERADAAAVAAAEAFSQSLQP